MIYYMIITVLYVNSRAT